MKEILRRLLVAIQERNITAILKLLETKEAREHIDTPFSKGKTLIMKVIEEDLGPDVLRRVLALGADITKKTFEDKTALMIAVKKGLVYAVLELIKHKNISKIINDYDLDFYTPLHKAIRRYMESFNSNYRTCMKLLLSAGANPSRSLKRKTIGL